MFRIAPYLVLLAEVVIFYRHALFDSSRYIIPWDLRYYHFPQAFFIARQFQAGEWPLWNPWVYCGMPWYAKIDSQLFYPPTVLAIAISNWFGGRRLWYFLELQVIGHVLLAGIFTYLLMRYLGAGRAASLVAATIYQLGAFFVTQTQHVGAIDAAAWAPLAWLGIEMLARRFSWPRMAILAGALAMVTLSGYPATAIPIFFSCGLLALLLVGLRQARWTLVPQVSLAVFWSAALAALPLLPSIQLSALSHAGPRGYWPMGHGGTPPQAFITSILPNYFGFFQFDPVRYNLPWNMTFVYLYCGIPGLVFFVAALLQRRCRRGYIYAAITAALGLWMVGAHTPVGWLIFHSLPKVFRGGLYFEFAMCMFVLGLAATAGLGADHLLRSRPRWIRVAVVVVVAGDLILVSSGRPFNTADRKMEPAIGYDHFEESQEIPRRMRQLVRQETPPWRFDLMNGSPLWNNGAMLFEVPTATGDDPFAPLRFLKVRNLFAEQVYWVRSNQIRQLDSGLIDYLNVRYILSSKKIDPDLAQRSGLRHLMDLPRQVVYENTEALPRFFLVGRVLPARDAVQGIDMLKTADLRREAVVEAADPSWRYGSSGTVQVIRYSANEVVLRTEGPGGAYLVTSETYFPGWRAWVDGNERPLYVTNGAFRGLPVPAGRHEVRMSFRPALLWQSALVAAAAWLLFAAAFLPAAASWLPWSRLRGPRKLGRRFSTAR